LPSEPASNHSRFGYQSRLTRSTEINRVFTQGKRLNCGVFLLFLYQRPPESTMPRPRICGVVSKRVSKRAADRNLLKRRIRSLLRECHLLLPQNYDLVMVARASMLQVPYAELLSRFKKACGNLDRP
jgi:ribonuclease P protein component